MTKDERSTCEQLFQRLHIKGKSQEEALGASIASLAAKYRIELN